MTATPAQSPDPSASPSPARTTGVQSVSMPVADQDRALAFYRDVLGCEVRVDTEIWPGARLIEVVPPGSSVGIILLPPHGDIPVAVRLGTQDAEEAHTRIRAAGVTLHNDKVLYLDGAPPMFSFTDPDGNGLVYLQDAPESTDS
jgi:catechol 2,3-dioxygenase-like lactoylglutathione lyase family enzyme